MVAVASASGSRAPSKPVTSRPSSSALMSVGRNGAEAGMVKTRGVWTMVQGELSGPAPARRPVITDGFDRDSDAGSSAFADHDATLCRAVEDRGFGGCHRVGRADVHPHAFEPKPVEPPGPGGPLEQRGQRKSARRSPFEELRRKDRRPGIDEWHHGPLAAPIEPPLGRHREIAAAEVTDAGGGGGKQSSA